MAISLACEDSAVCHFNDVILFTPRAVSRRLSCMASRSKSAGAVPSWLRGQAPLPDLFGTVSPLVAQMIADLRIGVALWHPPGDWNVIHSEPSVAVFESEHGQEGLRWPYNAQCLAQVQRTGEPVRGEHAGFKDLFVPVLDAERVCAVLVVGPYLTRRPTRGDIMERWVALTASQPGLGDPGFRHYIAATLSTPTLEGPLEPAFERLVSCLAELAGHHGSPRALVEEAKALRTTLAAARSAERMWDAVRGMVSERTARGWAARDQTQSRWEVGLRRIPGTVAVGLLVGRVDDTDAIEGLLRRDAFQRASVALARRTGGIACGKIGDHGVIFLSDETGPEAHASARTNDLVHKAQGIATRLGFKLHVGIGQQKRAEALPQRYLAALAAAERALSQSMPVSYGQRPSEHSAAYVRTLRQRLTENLGVGQSLSARFEHYAQVVLEHCGYALERVRARLEAGLERLSEPLLASGALDEGSFDELMAGLERSALEEATVTALVARYRQAVLGIEASIARPGAARHERSVRRATAFVRGHLGEPLSLQSVARVAGFAPGHFSKLFKRAENTTFEEYLLRLRLEHAKQLLNGTSLNVQGVGSLCGFRNRIHFHRAFKHVVGVTPAEYRASHRFSWDGVQPAVPATPATSVRARGRSRLHADLAHSQGHRLRVLGDVATAHSVRPQPP
jgi:AraC-like DNA-binding protein